MKKILLALAYIFLTSNVVHAATFGTLHGAHSEHRKYSADFGGDEWWMMAAGAWEIETGDGRHDIYLRDYPISGGDVLLPYLDGWSNLYPGYDYLYYGFFPHSGLGGTFPAPGDSSWVRDYTFFIDQDNSGDFSIGDTSISGNIASGEIQKIDYVTNVQISGDPKNPIVSWDDVTTADIDAYKVFVHPVIDGEVDIYTLLMASPDLPCTTFTGFGDIFQGNGEYAIAITARNYRNYQSDSGNWLNWSRYVFKHTIEDVTPVPEPTTMFLLGSGLVGLAGFRRKIVRKLP